MKITKEHLQQAERHLQDSLRDIRAMVINREQYGLLPSMPDGQPNLRIEVNPDEVSLHACRAVTPGGARIEFFTPRYEPLKASLPKAKAQFLLPETGISKLDVVLSVNPFGYVPGGAPDPDEEPARQPYTLPVCRLELLPAGQFRAAEAPFHLLLGRVETSESASRLDERFIPPCTALGCHEKLVAMHLHCLHLLKNVFANSKIINRRLRAIPAKSDVQSCLFGMTDWVTLHLAQHLDAFEYELPKQSPFAFFLWLKTLARLVQTSIEVVETDLLLRHLYHWLQKSSAELEGVVSSALEASYEHDNAAPCLEIVGEMAHLLSFMFHKLEQRRLYERMKDGDDIFSN
jgi:hypothetical protein